MKRRVWRAGLLAACGAVCAAVRVPAQTTPNPPGMNENRLHRDFRVEKGALGACRHFKSIADCGQTLVLGQPMHIAVGSLAPQNGVAAGLAFVEHTDFKKSEVRATYDIDAVAAGNGSWRAGAYLKAYRLGGGLQVRAAPLLSAYSQRISLKRVDYYGLGSNSSPVNHTTFGFGENITGANLILPTSGALHKAGVVFSGEINGRFPSVRAGSDSALPSIGAVFNDASAPGLARQVSYLQTGEGVRFVPRIPKDPFRLNYFLQFQQYTAPGSSTYPFRRFNADFDHVIPLRNVMGKTARRAYYEGLPPVVVNNGPDNCLGTSGSRNIDKTKAAQADHEAEEHADKREAVPCPVVALTDKLEGSITLRAFISESFADRGSVVPFYFQPTIGGSDINGTPMLASYPDYRFRGPDVLLFRGTIEHSLGKLPIGALFSVDEGKIGLRRNDVSLDHLRHTFSAGLTVHAGGLPVISLLFAWGGHEGHHTTTTVSPMLLGAGGRPSLF